MKKNQINNQIDNKKNENKRPQSAYVINSKLKEKEKEIRKIQIIRPSTARRKNISTIDTMDINTNNKNYDDDDNMNIHVNVNININEKEDRKIRYLKKLNDLLDASIEIHKEEKKDEKPKIHTNGFMKEENEKNEVSIKLNPKNGRKRIKKKKQEYGTNVRQFKFFQEKMQTIEKKKKEKDNQQNNDIILYIDDPQIIIEREKRHEKNVGKHKAETKIKDKSNYKIENNEEKNYHVILSEEEKKQKINEKVDTILKEIKECRIRETRRGVDSVFV